MTKFIKKWFHDGNSDCDGYCYIDPSTKIPLCNLCKNCNHSFAVHLVNDNNEIIGCGEDRDKDLCKCTKFVKSDKFEEK